MYSLGRSILKGAAFIGGGALVIATGGAAAAVIGPVLVGSGAYTAGSGIIRGARELVAEDEGECYFVYYPLKDGLLNALSVVLPDHLDTDFLASALDKKIAHLVTI